MTDYVTRRNVRCIISADAPAEFVAPLVARYPKHRKVGSSQSYFFSCWRNNPAIAPNEPYDFIDYCEQELTGEELYTMFKGELDSGFLGALQFTQTQGNLLQAYVNSITPEATE